MNPETYIGRMEVALEQAEIALYKGELPIGAVVATESDIIMAGHNQVVSRGLTFHAEQVVLTACDNREFLKERGLLRKDLTLFTTLEPCISCFGLAMNFNIGGIVSGLESPDDGATSLLDKIELVQVRKYFKVPNVTTGVLRERSQEFFREFCRRWPDSRMVGWASFLGGLSQEPA